MIGGTFDNTVAPMQDLLALPATGKLQLRGFECRWIRDGELTRSFFGEVDASRSRSHHRMVDIPPLHDGREALPFGADLWALPVNALWELGAQPVGKRR